jgi:hypothetical protein
MKDVAKGIKDKERSGVPRVIVLETGVDDSKFWQHLGGKINIASAEEGGDDVQAEKALWERVKLYQVCQENQSFELVEIGMLSELNEANVNL